MIELSFGQLIEDHDMKMTCLKVFKVKRLTRTRGSGEEALTSEEKAPVDRIDESGFRLIPGEDSKGRWKGLGLYGEGNMFIGVTYTRWNKTKEWYPWIEYVNMSTLYHGDCIEELSKVEDDSIHLIVTSPPYANQRKSTYGGIQYVCQILCDVCVGVEEDECRWLNKRYSCPCLFGDAQGILLHHAGDKRAKRAGASVDEEIRVSNRACRAVYA